MDPNKSALPTIPDARAPAGARRPRIERVSVATSTLETITMRNRHGTRLCHGCQAPIARQTDRCWKCGEDSTPDPRAAGRRRSLREKTALAQDVRARGHQDSNRRSRPPATRAPAAKEA
jgi:hypothetical protein